MLKAKTKTPQRGQWRRGGVLIVNFEQVAVSLVLTIDAVFVTSLIISEQL